MTRRTLMLSLSIACFWGVLSLAAAAGGGGGGCHQAPRPFDARTQVVAMEDYCFSPAVVRIEPKQSITWVNRDVDAHTVTGIAGTWGSYDELGRGGRVTSSIAAPGGYPYFCALHPGMVGAVVIGDGVAAGGVGEVNSGVASSATEDTATDEVAASKPGSSSEPGAAPWLWAAPIVLAAGGAAVALERHRRKLG